MNKFKNYTEWINEEMAAIGIPPAGNVSGMGNVSAPTNTATGSGDAWPSLEKPVTPKKSKRCKDCKKLKTKCTCK